MPYRTASPTPGPKRKWPPWLCGLLGHPISVGEVVCVGPGQQGKTVLIPVWIRTLCPRCGSFRDPEKHLFEIHGSFLWWHVHIFYTNKEGSRTTIGPLMAKLNEDFTPKGMVINTQPCSPLEPGFIRVHGFYSSLINSCPPNSQDSGR